MGEPVSGVEHEIENQQATDHLFPHGQVRQAKRGIKPAEMNQQACRCQAKKQGYHQVLHAIEEKHEGVGHHIVGQLALFQRGLVFGHQQLQQQAQGIVGQQEPQE